MRFMFTLLIALKIKKLKIFNKMSPYNIICDYVMQPVFFSRYQQKLLTLLMRSLY